MITSSRCAWFAGLWTAVGVAGCSHGDPHPQSGAIHVDLPRKTAYLLSELPGAFSLPVRIRQEFTSDNPVYMRLASKSCGCLDVKMPDGPVPSSTPIQLDVGVPRVPGRFSREIVLEFSTGNQPLLQKAVKLDYSIHSDREITPQRIIREWRAGKKDAPIELQFTCCYQRQQLSKENVVVTGLPSDLKLANVEGPKVSDLNDHVLACEWKIVLEHEAKLEPPPDLAGSFFVGLHGESPLEIRYEWLISKRVVLAPQVHYFDSLAVGKQAIRRCVLAVRDGDLPKIRKITCSNSAFSLGAPNDSQVLELRFCPTAVGRHHGFVSIFTDAPDAPELKLEVCGNGE